MFGKTKRFTRASWQVAPESGGDFFFEKEGRGGRGDMGRRVPSFNMLYRGCLLFSDQVVVIFIFCLSSSDLFLSGSSDLLLPIRTPNREWMRLTLLVL